LGQPFDLDNPENLVPLIKRTEDNLPAHVKNTVQWRSDLLNHPAGYYIYDNELQRLQAVEFVENYWHNVYQYTGFAYTSLAARTEPHTEGTGYWYLSDPQHPLHSEYIASLQGSTSTAPAPTLSVTTNVPSLSSDPTLSPFVTARVSSDSDSDSSSTPREGQGSDDPSPEQLHPEDPVLTAQLQYGLDIQDREPENPLTPDEPAYQQLIEDAVDVTNYVRHPSRNRGKPRDLSLSYAARDRGNTRDQA
jgi:hypothetical protein